MSFVDSFSWDDLRILLLVADHGSLHAAADALDISHTTLGRRIRSLEQALGCQLTERTVGAAIRLTDMGTLAVQEARRMEEAAQDLHRKLSGSDENLSGSLRITTTEGLATFWLATALQPFLEQHPDLHVHWDTRNERGVEVKDTEIGIAWWEPKEPNLVRRKLGVIGYSLFAMPNYFQKYGMPTSLEDLKNHRLLHFSGYEQNPGLSQWCAFTHRVGAAMTLQSGASAQSVMSTGNFMALLPDYASIVVPTVTKIPLETNVSLEVWLAYHEDRRGQARVRAVSAEIARLADEARGTWFSR